MSTQSDAEQIFHDTIKSVVDNYLNNSRYPELCFGTVVSYNSTNHTATITYSTDTSTQVPLKNLSHFTLAVNDSVVVLRHGTSMQQAYIIGDLTQL